MRSCIVKRFCLLYMYLRFFFNQIIITFFIMLLRKYFFHRKIESQGDLQQLKLNKEKLNNTGTQS